MDLFKKVDKDLLKIIRDYTGEIFVQNPRLATNVRFTIPPVQTGCDYSTNVAMVFAKSLGKDPMTCATELAEMFKKLDYIKEIEVTKGYINIIFKSKIWEEFLAGIVADKEEFGDGDLTGKVLLEFISANPTGPLHVGHCRGAILGLAMANLLKKAGYDVTKEYYVNDYGVQINTLVKSIQFRYQQFCGKHVDESVPEGCYPGEYLIEYAQKLYDEFGDKYAELTEEDFYARFKKPAVNAMMDIIRTDLKLLGLEYDSFASETDIVENGEIEKVLEFLSEKYAERTNEDGEVEKLSYVYKGILDKPIGGSANEEENEDGRLSDEPQTLFRSTLFGDDKDRVILRSDGTTTYFASDIAYHKNKYDRGYKIMINLLGADHGGYVKRIVSAVDAISDQQSKLEIVLNQLVNLEKNGVPFRMSKRKGTFVLLSDVVKEIDVDELKLFMLSKSADTPMTFDLVKVKEKSKDNLVYYIQYACARTNSLLKKFNEQFGYEYNFNEEDVEDFVENCPKLIKEIIVLLAKFPTVIVASANKRAPHMIVDYLKELAALFHSLWGTNIKLIKADDEKHSRAMAGFVSSVQVVFNNALKCLGIEPKKVMNKESVEDKEL